MNNENNNLNGSVLGNMVVEPTPTNNPNPENPVGSQVQPVQNPVPEPTPNVLEAGNTIVEPQNQVIEPTNNGAQGAVVQNATPTVEPGNVVMDNTVVEPQAIESQAIQSQAIEQQGLQQQAAQTSPSANPESTPTTPSAPAPAAPQNPMPNGEVANGVNGQASTPNVEPLVAPSPAYTNPQTISPAPMPGFEAPNSVGTTPPISLTKEKQPKKPVNKIAFVVLIVGILILIGFGTYYILNYTNLLNKKTTITLETKDIQINLGDSLPTSNEDYATVTGTEINNCTKNLDDVNLNEPGEYKFTITCGNISKEGKIEVIDNTELVVVTQKVYKSVKDTTIDPAEFLATQDINVKMEFINEAEILENLKTPGTYEVALKATANNGKTVDMTEKLIVLQYSIKGELICSANSQNVTGSSAKMVAKNVFAIVDDGSNGYGNIAREVYEFTFSDETEFSDVLKDFSDNNSLTINNITGKDKEVNIDYINKVIVIEKDADNDEIVSKYGQDNLKTYGTIKAYFQDNLGYQCGYEIIE